MKCKKSILLLLIVLLSFPIIGLFVKNRIRTQVKDLFRMNKVLQEEGYYMGEFEFKMMGIIYYLDLQNPKTGAFMDDSFPYCTFNEPTENVIAHLDELAKKMGVPLKLKYPLKYLERINPPEKPYEFLDDVSYIGWFGSRFPETTFVFARSLASDWNDEGVIGQNNLYSFSNDFKTAL